MFKVARIMISVGLVELLLATIILGYALWPWPLIIAITLFAASCYGQSKVSSAFGTARWMNEDELRRDGMVGGKKGLAIGRLENSGITSWIPSLIAMFHANVPSKLATDFFMARVRKKRRQKEGEIVRLSNSVHTVVFGPTGAGKGTSFIIPWLLETDESAIVLDYKGENALITAKHREQVFGHQTVLLDPFHVVTNKPDRLNPVDSIVKDSPIVIDDCRELAEQLVVRTGEEREPHFNDAAEMWIGAAVAAVAQYAPNDNRSLQTVRNILSNPDKVPELIELLCQGDEMFGRLGGQLAHFRDRELASTLTTANRHLRFLDTPAIAASTASSTFDPRQLRNGKMTVYCILPPEYIRSQSALIRMWIGTLMHVVVKGGLQRG